MKIELDLHSLAQMRAFATFIATLAEERESEVREKLSYGNVIGGGINQTATEAGAAEKGALETFAETQLTTAIVRKRGEPSPGHKRRTKAEIAEDEAASAASGSVADITQPAISTGGERVAPDDDPETVRADAADEASETAKAGAELSHENLRDAMGKYVQKYGMDAAQLDGPKVLALALKNPEVKKISAVPTDQKSLKAALDGINEMWLKNPFGRDTVA